MKREPPIIKGTAEILDEEGNVIGHETVAYNNPNYKFIMDSDAGT